MPQIFGNVNYFSIDPQKKIEDLNDLHPDSDDSHPRALEFPKSYLDLQKKKSCGKYLKRKT